MANNRSRTRRYAQMRMASGGNRSGNRGGNQGGNQGGNRSARSEMNMAYPRMGGGDMNMGGGYGNMALGGAYSEMRGALDTEYGGMTYGEARFRDRRGREHYDNGRFAPRSAMDGHDGMESRMGDDGEPESRRRYRRTSDGRFRSGMDDMEDAYPGRVPPVWRGEAGMAMNPIGFNANREVDYNYRSDAGYYPRSETESNPGQMSGGGASSNGMKFSREAAKEWVENMDNEDGSTGPHWTMEQTKRLQTQKGIQADELEFWVVMNMMYSDYCKAVKKSSVSNPTDLYAELAKAFLMDKDAHKDKLARYWEYVVKH